MCSTCDQFDVFKCHYCKHWVSLTEEAVRHHEDTGHPQLVIARLRSQLRLAQDLQRATQGIVERLSVTLTATQELLEQQTAEMAGINEEYTEVVEHEHS